MQNNKFEKLLFDKTTPKQELYQKIETKQER